MEPMYVICFYWEGDRWQRRVNINKIKDESYKKLVKRTGDVSLDLASRYVNNLYHGIKKYATRDFEFICFTNEKLSLVEGVIKREFPLVTRTGVLPRIFMFSPEAGMGERQVLCLDLDVMIVGSLEKIMAYNGLFCARSKFNPDETYKLDGDIMSFRAGDKTSQLFWDPFVANVEKAVEWTKGRERYWVRHIADDFADRWDTVAPGTVCSYKWHVRKNNNKIPDGTSIISFHGTPRPHQVKNEELRNQWNS